MSECQDTVSEQPFEQLPESTAPKRRGRPPGSSTKAKTFEAGVSHAFPNRIEPEGLFAAGVGPGKAEPFGPTLKKASISSTGLNCEPAKFSPEAATAAAEARQKFGMLNLAAMGGSRRTLLVIVRDVSPSEMEYDAQFRAGGNSIAPTLAADPLAATRVDIALCYGAEGFKVVSVGHAKDFVMPATTEFGSGTCGTPWFQKIPGVCKGYDDTLAEAGLEPADKVVVIASDFLFGDQFVDALKEFRAWQSANPNVVLVPAGYGRWEPRIAEQVSLHVRPVDLGDLRITDFVRIVAESVREMSYDRPENRARLIEMLNGLNG